MVSYEAVCEMFDGKRSFNQSTEFDLTKCTAMIGNENGEQVVIYLPLDDNNNPNPTGIGEEVKEVVTSLGLESEFDLDGEAIVAQ